VTKALATYPSCDAVGEAGGQCRARSVVAVVRHTPIAVATTVIIVAIVVVVTIMIIVVIVVVVVVCV
jgi:hypothetical protein